MLIRFALFLAAALAFFAPPPAHAVEDGIGDGCAQLPQSVGPDEIAWMRHTLQDGFPVRFAPILKTIAIEASDDPALLAPVYRPGANPLILVPDRFFVRACRAIGFQSTFADNDVGYHEAAEQLIGRCVASGAGAALCLDEGLEAYWKAHGHKGGPTLMSQEEVRTTLAWGTVNFILRHEAAHAILRETLTPRQLMKIDEEVEADLLSYTEFIHGAISPIGPAMLFATLSLVERPDDSAYSLHESAACRARASFSLTKPLSFFSSLLATLRSDDPKELEQQLSALETIVGQKLYLRHGITLDCEESADALITQYANEMTELVTAVRSAGLGKKSLRQARLSQLQVVLDYEPKNRAGKSLAYGLSVSLFTKLSNELSGSKRDPGADNQARQSMRQVAAAILDNDSLTSSEAMTMMGWLALTDYFNHPSGTRTVDAARQLHRDLEAAFAVSHPLRRAQNNFYVAKFGLPTDGSIDQWVHIHSRNEMVAYGCEDRERIANLISNRMKRLVGSPKQMTTQEACRIFRANQLARIKRLRGWR